MKKTEVLLLVIDAASESGLSPIQLQKILFLLGKKLPYLKRKNYYHFVPHYFGPFDPTVYTDAQSLEDAGHINISRLIGESYKNYRIDAKGIKEVRKIKARIDGNTPRIINEITKKVKEMTFNDLLRYIYKNYPEFKRNSVFNG